ncbi:MAG: UDP-glucose/GDP-mannose dehydrogenase family protein [Acidobacteriota bacterium]|nr:UDP-glucose/GDP-mannose dehydrogenase family protein [Acidobacteriota bacterium]
MRVTVIGTGYVGTVTGVCLGYLGHRVTCVDTDASKIAKLRSGEIPIFEPHLADLLPLARKRGGVEFETELAPAVAASDVIFIAVGTPSQPGGEANLSYLEAAARSIGAAMDTSRFRVVVNKSTVPVGCGNLVETLVREGISDGGRDPNIRFGVASNPEFLREGSAIADSLFPDRIVLGSEDGQTIDVLRQLYRRLIEQDFEPPAPFRRPDWIGKVPLVTTTLTSAEMIKYAANAFLAMKIGFSNEMANICEKVGADALEVMAGIGFDSRIGLSFLNAGIGWGGSCFGKDIQSLLHIAGEYGYQARLLEASLAVNRQQRHLVIQKLQEKLYILKGRTVGLLGLAFKPNTDDLRDAPSLQIAEKLLQMGARVRVYDPVAMEACREQYPGLRITYCPDVAAVAAKADALVVVTEWPEFKILDLPFLAGRMAHAVLVDGRNLFDPETARRAGFDYAGVGRGARQNGNGEKPAEVVLAEAG